MGCGVYYSQINELTRALSTMRKYGITEAFPAYQKLNSIRGGLLSAVGLKYPRTITLLLRLIGLSPGSIALWHDVESGWLAEARAKPGAPPVYHYVPDETAMAILKGEVTHELEQQLLTPDEYLGE